MNKIKSYFFGRFAWGRLGLAIHVLQNKPLMYKMHLLCLPKYDKSMHKDAFVINNIFDARTPHD
jgi:hypothetical protein